MAEPDQVLDEPLRAADAVAEDRVAVDSGDRPVDQHERDPESGQPCQVRLRPVADRCDRDPLDPVSDQLLDHVALDREVGAGVAEDDAVGGSPGDFLGRANDHREERVGDVGHDHGERPGAAAAQPTREPARYVAELEIASQHGAASPADAIALVDHPRDRHRRHAGEGGDVLDRHVG